MLLSSIIHPAEMRSPKLPNMSPSSPSFSSSSIAQYGNSCNNHNVLIPFKFIRGGGMGDIMGDGSSSSASFQVSSYAVKGGRNYMEDEHVIKNGGRFAAVFDGHGGSAVSLYLKQNLYAHYLQCISKISISNNGANMERERSRRKRRSSNSSSSHAQSIPSHPHIKTESLSSSLSVKKVVLPPSLQDTIKAFRAAFREIDQQVQQVSHWSYQGSTAVAVYLYEHFVENERLVEEEEDHLPKETKSNRAQQKHRFSKKSQSTKKHTKRKNSSTYTTTTSSSSKPTTHPKHYKRAYTLVSFNVGDSRAILSRDGTAIELTTDHKPDTPTERERIEALGGQVTWCGKFDPMTKKPILKTGIYRMNGNLALSRAIGDRSEKPCVSSSVDVKVIDLKLDKNIMDEDNDGEKDIDVHSFMDKGDEFIVLGSDGLWDVMDNQEVVDFIHEFIQVDDDDIIDYEEIDEDSNDDDGHDIIGLGMESHTWGMSDDDNDDIISLTSTNFPHSIHDRQLHRKNNSSSRSNRERRKRLRFAKRKENQSKVAQYLTKEALRRGSTDNITTIVIWLHQEPWMMTTQGI